MRPEDYGGRWHSCADCGRVLDEEEVCGAHGTGTKGTQGTGPAPRDHARTLQVPTTARGAPSRTFEWTADTWRALGRATERYVVTVGGKFAGRAENPLGLDPRPIVARLARAALACALDGRTGATVWQEYEHGAVMVTTKLTVRG